jgi:hypothetical protein
MPTLYKVKEHTSNGDGYVYHQTSADIVEFDSSKTANMGDTTVQEAIETINSKVENCASRTSLKEATDKINEDIEKLNDKANTTTYTARILAKGFEGTVAPFTQVINVEGITANDNPIVGVIESDSLITALEQKDSWGSINRIKCDDGFITAYCYEDLPSVDLDIQLKVIR